MARWWLFWASLAAVLARSDDCSEQHDSVCPASQYRMGPRRPVEAPGPTALPSSGGTTTPVPTSSPTPTPTTTTTTPATEGGRRLRPRAPNGTVASNAETDEVVDIYADWAERFMADYDRSNGYRPTRKKKLVIRELSKVMSVSDLDQIQNQPLDELLALVLGHIRDKTPVEFADLVVRIRDESDGGVAVKKAPSFPLSGHVLALACLY